jgi:hypothetical protein
VLSTADLVFACRSLPTAAGIHHNTVNSFETGRYAAETIVAICKALEKAGVEFTNGKKPGLRLSKA